MRNWYMLTLVGADRPGIVAQVTEALFRAGCNLGEASMLRLGANFTVSMMVEHAGDADSLAEALGPAARAFDLHVHVDPIVGTLHRHVVPDARVRVHGADRPGIVARVTAALAGAGLNITDLASDVAGTGERPLYVLQIEGVAQRGMEPLRAALAGLDGEVEVSLEPVDTVVG